MVGFSCGAAVLAVGACHDLVLRRATKRRAGAASAALAADEIAPALVALRAATAFAIRVAGETEVATLIQTTLVDAGVAAPARAGLAIAVAAAAGPERRAGERERKCEPHQ